MSQGKYCPGALKNLLSGTSQCLNLIEDFVDTGSTNLRNTPFKKCISINATNTAAVDGEQAECSSLIHASSKNVEKRIRRRIPAEENSRTIFVGNLPPTSREKELKLLFKEFGKIESIRIRSIISADPKVPKKAALLTNTMKVGLKSLNAYVKFVDSNAVSLALGRNGVMLGDHRLRVDSCAGSNKYNGDISVFVGNLPLKTTDDAVYEHFADCGSVEAVRVVRDRYTGIGKGFGFVSFLNKESVALALKLNGHDFCGRPLRISKIKKNIKQTKTDHSQKKTSLLKLNQQAKVKKYAIKSQNSGDYAVGVKKNANAVAKKRQKSRISKQSRSLMNTL